MRKFFTIASALMLGTFSANAQTVADFESLSLSSADTFYVNYSAPGTDVGFNSGLAHFYTNYDTAGYSSLRGGFVYSNMTDSVTSGYTNPNSAKAAAGYNGSSQYAVSYGNTVVVLTGNAAGKPVNGFYASNTTYAYNSMRDGDAFGRKFGDSGTVVGSHPDWFKLTVYGYLNGTIKADTVDFYLADFRDADDSKDYILKTWEWVDLLPLGNVDSVEFKLTSSDVGAFGMNTPAYFCLDNFTTNETEVSVGNTPKAIIAKVYPNPAVSQLTVQVDNNSVKQLVVYSLNGQVVAQQTVTSDVTSIDVSRLASGTYVLQMIGEEQSETIKFVKQ